MLALSNFLHARFLARQYFWLIPASLAALFVPVVYLATCVDSFYLQEQQPPNIRVRVQLIGHF